MNPLAIVCPSRGRPDVCKRMIESALDNSNADVLVYVDNDDDTRHEYPHSSERVRVHHHLPIGRGAAVNELIRCYPDYRMYLIVSDDITFVRSDWEAQVVAAMDAFGDDLGIVHLASENGAKYANWVVASKKWIDTLGWFNYPGCRWFCQDTIIQVLAEALGRIRFIEPKVIHHHVIHDYDVEARMVPDTRAFLWYMAQEFGGDLAKLREAAAPRIYHEAKKLIEKYGTPV